MREERQNSYFAPLPAVMEQAHVRTELPRWESTMSIKEQQEMLEEMRREKSVDDDERRRRETMCCAWIRA